MTPPVLKKVNSIMTLTFYILITHSLQKWKMVYQKGSKKSTQKSLKAALRWECEMLKTGHFLNATFHFLNY
jgi:hypothetical protein